MVALEREHHQDDERYHCCVVRHHMKPFFLYTTVSQHQTRLYTLLITLIHKRLFVL